MGSIIAAFRQKELPEQYFRLQVTILRALGIELVKEETFYYKIYSRIALVILCYCFTAGEAFELYSQSDDLNTAVTVLTFLFTHTLGAIKTTLLFINRKKIGTVLKQLHQPPFKPDFKRGGSNEEKYIRDVINATEIQAAVYFGFVSLTLMSGGLVFLWTRIMYDKDGWQYPFLPITLFDTTYTPIFELASLYQFTNMTLYAFIIATLDILLSTIIAQLSVQLKILQNALRNMRSKAEELQKEDGGRRDIDHYTTKLLGDHIRLHQQIFTLADDMEGLCSLMFLICMTAIVVLLCFLLYQSSRYPLGSMDFIKNFLYYWIIFCEIGISCYWGNEVTLESSNVSQAAAEAYWPDAPLSVSKALVLVIARSQMQLQLTAGKFVPLSLETFMSILKGSFSYFMVLRETQGVE